MAHMQKTAEELTDKAQYKYVNLSLRNALNWDLSGFGEGDRFEMSIVNGGLAEPNSEKERHFRDYLKQFEVHNRLAEEFDNKTLTNPVVYFPVNRTAGGFQSSVQLSGYNEGELRRQFQASHSRQNSSPVGFAIGRLAQTYRLLLEADNGKAAEQFYNDPYIEDLTRLLREIGYEWKLISTNPLTNQYDVQLTKQGTSFLVDAASSGEKELLTYIFSIFALNVRDALIIVDEPELHLHPKWQKKLLYLFEELADSTGNQFLLATHSPTFISPESIKFISRVYSAEQRSRIAKLDYAQLPEAKHLLSIVNSQNNERVFFADRVVLVEGISDRVFFEAVLDHLGLLDSRMRTLEIISVGGKGLFSAYAKVLQSAQVDHRIIADRDYIREIGTPAVKDLFQVDSGAIKRAIKDASSIDADTLVAAIDEAIGSNSWSNAEEVWNYIKGRRTKLIPNLSEQQQVIFDQFVNATQSSGTRLLKQGVLEDYLPPGFFRKDIDKLVRFLGQKNFWSELSKSAQEEILEIATWATEGL